MQRCWPSASCQTVYPSTTRTCDGHAVPTVAPKCAVAFDGQTRWCFEFYRLTATAADGTEAVYSLPLPFIGGVVWDGTSLWVMDTFPGNFYRISSDGKIQAAHALPYRADGSSNYYNLGWDGSRLLVNAVNLTAETTEIIAVTVQP